LTAENLFLVFNYSILPAWLLLIFAPGWRPTQAIVHSFWIPLVVAAAYLFSLVSGSGESTEGASFSSLPGIMLIFASPWSALAGWLHYLVFDLFVGAWEVRDARRQGIPHGWVVPCLLLTLMLGPVGLGLYAGLRLVRGGNASLVEARP